MPMRPTPVTSSGKSVLSRMALVRQATGMGAGEAINGAVLKTAVGWELPSPRRIPPPIFSPPEAVPSLKGFEGIP